MMSCNFSDVPLLRPILHVKLADSDSPVSQTVKNGMVSDPCVAFAE
jgi:hypothetical protein